MPEPLLSLTGVHAGYAGTEILRGVDFAVHSGEIVTVLGPNGAGKSTMSRTISGVIRAWHGAIRFKGSAIEHEETCDLVASLRPQEQEVAECEDLRITFAFSRAVIGWG